MQTDTTHQLITILPATADMWDADKFNKLNFENMHLKNLVKLFRGLTLPAIVINKLDSRFSRRVTARGSCTGLVAVGPAKV